MKIQQAVHLISGDPDQFSLRHRIYNITALITIIGSLYTGIINLYIRLLPAFIAPIFIFMGIMIFLYYLSRCRQKLNLARNISCVIIILFFLPVGWVLNGGTNGGAHYMVLLFALVICAICSGWKRNLFLMLLVLMIIGLGIFEYYCTDYIYSYSNKAMRCLDVLLGIIITMVFIVSLFQTYLKNYDHERARVMAHSRLMEEMAITDGLTGLFNHSYINQALEDKINESVHYFKDLSIIMFDLDHFKNINDSYGHEFGNTVLVAVADTMKSNIRNTDLVGRYGGEEFLIICPDTGLDEAVVLAERIRGAVARLVFGNGVTITISGGAASLDTNIEMTAISFIEKADDALYSAKRLERNKIVALQNQIPANALS